MLSFKKIVLSLFFVGIYGGFISAQQTVSVTFKSDQTITAPIEITFGRDTKTLPPFTAPTGSSVLFGSGLKVNTAYTLKAFDRKNNLSSQNYIFTISPVNTVITIIVSINPKLQTTQQIIFKPNSGQLLPQRAGL